MPIPFDAEAVVLVTEAADIGNPLEVLVDPSSRTGSSGEEHEASHQPPRQDEVSPQWWNRDLLSAVQEGHEVEKPMRVVRLATII